MKLYVPSFWGDINLESSGPKETILRTERATVIEQGWILRLLKAFKTPVPSSENLSKALDITVKAPWAKVSKYLTKISKGDNVLLVSTMKVKSGEIEEAKSLEEVEAKGAAAAVATEVPKRGCPAPIYDESRAREIRARAVLDCFLNESQRTSFRAGGAVAVIGADTRHRYIVSHRDSMSASRRGMVFDATGNQSICSHRTDLPSAEELLALCLVLQLPLRETQWLNEQIGQ